MQCVGKPSTACAPTRGVSLSSKSNFCSMRLQRPATAPVLRATLPAVRATVATETKEVAMEAGRAAMREWWLTKLAEKPSNGAAAAAATSGSDALAALEQGRAEMREWWLAQLQAKKLDAARAEMRAWWLGQLEEKRLDTARAEMRAWWIAQLEAREEDARLDAARAEMRDWWMCQLAAKAGTVEGATQHELDAARAEMRAWWLAQLEAKGGQGRMEAARAEMREWWLAQLAEKAEQGRMDAARAEMREWTVNKWKQAREAAETGAEDRVQDALEAGRAAMREWWTEKLQAKEAAATVAGETAATVADVLASVAAPVGDEALEMDPVVEAELELAAQYVSDTERLVIEEQLGKERARRERKIREREEEILRGMERGRRDMRKWWEEKREATKRSYGLGGYEPAWRLKFVPAAIASVFGAPTPTSNSSSFKEDQPPEPVEILGKGVVVGLAPVAEEAGVSTYTLIAKGVSFSHAYLYGKDKFIGFRKFAREYFVVDLSSTSGTFVNGKRLGTNVPHRLQADDVISFGTEVAFKVERPTR